MSDVEEVTEAEAEGKIKAIFDDVRATLGVLTVGPLFRRLAVHPWYLQLAWRNLKPNASTAYFHRMAEELRELAAGGRSRYTGDIGDAEHQKLDAHVKRLLATAALRVGTNGQSPKMNWLSAADTQSVTPAQPQQVATDQAKDGERQSTHWDTALEPLVAELRRAAAMAAESLPYRMEISATACRQSGLTEDQIDEVRRIIDDAWHWEPRAVLTVASRIARSAERQPLKPEPVATA